MARKVTAWFLVITTLTGPFTCCCTTAQAMSSVLACLGYDPVNVASTDCCHEPATPHEHSHGVAHHDHGDGHKHSDVDHSASNATHSDRHQESPHQCPCQKDRCDSVGLPTSNSPESKLVSTALDLVWMTLTLGDTTVTANAVDARFVADFCRPDGTCLSGREILRAHSVLRI